MLCKAPLLMLKSDCYFTETTITGFDALRPKTINFQFTGFKLVDNGSFNVSSTVRETCIRLNVRNLSEYEFGICIKLFSVYKIVRITLVIIFSIYASAYSASFTVEFYGLGFFGVRIRSGSCKLES